MGSRDTLLAAVATTLAGVAGGRVYRLRREQLPTLPAVVIEPRSEEASEVALGVTDRRMDVDLIIFAKGDTPDNAADATLSAVWAALYATPTLGLGSNVQLEPAHRVAWDAEDFDYVRATLSVTYNYRTATGAM
jgi:hypothetical protein